MGSTVDFRRRNNKKSKSSILVDLRFKDGPPGIKLMNKNQMSLQIQKTSGVEQNENVDETASLYDDHPNVSFPANQQIES